MLNDIFDTVISYSREEALKEGQLVALPANLVKEAGLKVHVAVTKAVHEQCVALTKAAIKMGCEQEGRAWDILHMFKVAYIGELKAHPNLQPSLQLTFQLYVVNTRVRPTLTTLKAVLSPGDNGEPTLTIMFPNES